MATSPILSLDTLIERPKIAIDGKLHAILSPEELPVLVSHKLSAQGRRMDELMKLDTLGEDAKRELQSLVREISNTIMEPVPARVRDKLSEAQRMSLIEVFTGLLLRRRLSAAAAMVTGPSQTGGKSFPGSSASTAESPDGGSPKRRVRS